MGIVDMGGWQLRLFEVSLFAGLVFSVSMAYADVSGIGNCTCDYRCYVNGTYAYADWKWVWNQTDIVPAGSELYKEKLIYWNDSNVTENVTIIGWYVDDGAMDAEWDGAGYNISVDSNHNWIDVADTFVNSSDVSGLSNYTLWDDTMPLEIAFLREVGAAQVVGSHWFRGVNITAVNSTGQEITNVIFSVDSDVELVEGTEYLNVTWGGVGYNITPALDTSTCNGSSPDYETPLGVYIRLNRESVGDGNDSYDFSEKMRYRASQTPDEDILYDSAHLLGGVYGIVKVGNVDYDSVDCTGYSYIPQYVVISSGATYCVLTKEGDYAKIRIVGYDQYNYAIFYWDIFDVFYVCKQDTDSDGMIDYFKVKQPYANDAQYEVGGEIFRVYNVSVEVSGGLAAGKPGWVSVSVSDQTGHVSGAVVNVTEKNGYSAFAPVQVWGSSGLVSYSTAAAMTDAGGSVNFTFIPTGGLTGLDERIGVYNVSLTVAVDGNVEYAMGLDNVSRDFSLPDEGVSFANRNNVDFVKDRVYAVYDRMNGWLLNGGGVSHDVVVFANNGTACGANFSVVSGRPTGVYVMVVDNGTPLVNATVTLTEKNGYSLFAPVQVWGSSGLVSYSRAVAVTDADGSVNFTFVPTGGLLGEEERIGEYNITFAVSVNGSSVYEDWILCSDRSLPAYSSGATVPNSGNVSFVSEKVYEFYDSVKEWMDFV